jgi:hypothetical protein
MTIQDPCVAKGSTDVKAPPITTHRLKKPSWSCMPAGTPPLPLYTKAERAPAPFLSLSTTFRVSPCL